MPRRCATACSPRIRTRSHAQRAADPALDHESPLAELFEEQLGCRRSGRRQQGRPARRRRLAGGRATGPRRAAPGRAPGPRPPRRACRSTSCSASARRPRAISTARRSHHDDGEDHEHDDFLSFHLDAAGARRPRPLRRPARGARSPRHPILRVKGFLAVAGKPMRLVLQGVGDRIQHYFDRAWRAGEPRAGRLVVIGERGLDRQPRRGGARRLRPMQPAMHLLNARAATPEDAGEAVDLGQTPGDIVVLSAADTELACLAAAAGAPARGRARACASPTCSSSATRSRSTSTSSGSSRAPGSSSLRLLGGRSYWPYGLEQVAAACRARRHPARGAAGRRPARPGARRLVDAAARGLPSPLAVRRPRRPRQRRAAAAPTPRACSARDEPWQEPAPLLRAGLYWPGLARPALADLRRRWRRGAAGRGARLLPRAGPGRRPRGDRRADRGARRRRPQPAADLHREPQGPGRGAAGPPSARRGARPTVVLNATGFAVSSPGAAPPDAARRARPPVLQLVLAGGSEAAWRDGTRGLSPRDLAMNVALPEIDGRVLDARGRVQDAASASIRAPRADIVGFAPGADRVALRGRARRRLGAARRAARGRAPGRARARQLPEPRRPARQRRRPRHAGEHGRACCGRCAAAGYRVDGLPADGQSLVEALLAGVTNAARRPRAAPDPGARFRSTDYLQVLRATAGRSARKSQRDDGASRTPIRMSWTARSRSPCCRSATSSSASSRRAATTSTRPPATTTRTCVPPHGYLAFYAWLRQELRRPCRRPRRQARQSRMAAGQGAGAVGGLLARGRARARCPTSTPSSSTTRARAPRPSGARAAVIVDHLTPPLTRAESLRAARRARAAGRRVLRGRRASTRAAPPICAARSWR